MTALVEITTTLPDAVALDAIPPLNGYTVETVSIGTPGPGAPPAGTPDNYIAASIGGVTTWVAPGTVSVALVDGGSL